MPEMAFAGGLTAGFVWVFGRAARGRR